VDCGPLLFTNLDRQGAAVASQEQEERVHIACEKKIKKKKNEE
jgi:hypothetical protein